MKKEKALISACLIGERCRYDGKTKKVEGILGLAKYYDLIPMRRGAEPREIAYLVRFLASEESNFITGQEIMINGGYLM